ncbi:Alg9-like mannosyltransferase family-domain-containing protein [Hyaloraphidium curvatum]|nr:Alg9-like mannosyltransferase family-domain-containing protein [Hyaloraphidium curvatum]
MPRSGRRAGSRERGPPVARSGAKSSDLPASLWLLVLLFRVCNSLSIATFFQPDEYWQSLEVAHVQVFRYGYLTWEWRERIRSFVHPSLYAALFHVLKVLQLDASGTELIVAAKVLGGIIAAAGDYFTCRLASVLFDANTGTWALLCSIVSWFNYFCMPRAFSNTAETVLTTLGLSVWPWPHLQASSARSLPLALTIAALGCLVRPTNALIWVPVGLHFVVSAPRPTGIRAIALAALIGSMALAVGMVVDRSFYGVWTLTAQNFYRLNLVEGISLFYGQNPWHWYLSQGWPVLLGPLAFVPIAAAVLRRRPTDHRQSELILLSIIAWTTVAYSFLGHKEFRFLLPVLPLALILCARAWKAIGLQHRAFAFLVVTLNAGLAWYATRVHQRGVMDVMDHLRSGAQAGTVRDAFFLMPCHSTPFQSYIHVGPGFSMDFLTCEPPLGISDKASYLDEAALFHANPVDFLEHRFPRNDSARPCETFVVFEAMLPQIGSWLADHGYREVARFFNSHFHDDRRRRGDVVVLRC